MDRTLPAAGLEAQATVDDTSKRVYSGRFTVVGRPVRRMSLALVITFVVLFAASFAGGQSARAQVYDGYWGNDYCYYVWYGAWYADGCYLGYQDFGALGVHRIYGRDADPWVYFFSYELGRNLFAIEKATQNGWYSDGTQWIYLGSLTSGAMSPADVDIPVVVGGQSISLEAIWGPYHEMAGVIIDTWNAPACVSSYNGC